MTLRARLKGAGRAVVERVREPSTWAGLSALALILGREDAAHAAALLGQVLPDAIAAAAAVLAVLMRERRA